MLRRQRVPNLRPRDAEYRKKISDGVRKVWKPRVSEQEVRRLYIDLGLSTRRAAAECGTDGPNFSRLLKKYGIPTRAPHFWHGSRQRNGIGAWKYGHGFTKSLRDSVKSRDGYMCQKCKASGASARLAVHHIDRDKDNHSMGNLITLCVVCHGAVHGAQRVVTKENSNLLQG